MELDTNKTTTHQGYKLIRKSYMYIVCLLSNIFSLLLGLCDLARNLLVHTCL